MKRIVPIYVRLTSLLIAVGITTLMISIHAADLTTLGAPDAAAASTAAVATASATGSYRITVADSRLN
jgi:hypothetical protein